MQSGGGGGGVGGGGAREEDGGAEDGSSATSCLVQACARQFPLSLVALRVGAVEELRLKGGGKLCEVVQGNKKCGWSLLVCDRWLVIMCEGEWDRLHLHLHLCLQPHLHSTFVFVFIFTSSYSSTSFFLIFFLLLFERVVQQRTVAYRRVQFSNRCRCRCRCRCKSGYNGCHH